ncbi:MAG: sigma-54-dependent Fis family transcriptional regulator [Candidatus Mcinerneyibacterium aminivorans]|uniref:Sigma-54-dependent Fis family transcriptional regulator n=1 Tax=Candidatus Mcinerneyibacterium aminivorans TaxID=2703815 RepID=A0A5D0MIY6_9BACT|nr:MAG: sigma-54-dependent Fis family transcriptional regulator [Candidatus Mcinerneyibacterium aminivorans]
MKILIVEDDRAQLKYLSNFVESLGNEVFKTVSGKKAIELIKNNADLDLIISDYKLEELNGLIVLNKAKEINKDIDVIIVTAYGNTDDAVFAMKKGAYDYINKPLNFDELKLIIDKIKTKNDLENQVESFKSNLEKPELIYKSDKMKEVINKADNASQNDVTVLIHGESGTGKELVAEYIHNNSNRKNSVLVKVFCAAIPENLIESELFGYRKGAFTGAEEDYKGKFEYADGGSILIDEITEIPLNLQVKLLRVIENKEITRVGEHRSKKLDIKFITTTNRKIQEEVNKGNFREDLLYRINVFPIEIPPLRKRKEDIDILVDYFLKKYNKKYGTDINLADNEIEQLKNYNWPGNVRELENTIINLVISGNKNILNNLFSENIIKLNNTELTLDELEKKYIRKILKKTDNNKTEAAKILNIHRNTLQRKIKEYNLDS